MSMMDPGSSEAAQEVTPGWYPTAVKDTNRWWDGQSWTNDLVVNGSPMTVAVYRQRVRAVVIVWFVLVAVFLLTILLMAIVFRSSAVLWAAVPSCLIVVVLGAIAGSIGLQRLKLITRIGE